MWLSGPISQSGLHQKPRGTRIANCNRRTRSTASAFYRRKLHKTQRAKTAALARGVPLFLLRLDSRFGRRRTVSLAHNLMYKLLMLVFTRNRAQKAPYTLLRPSKHSPKLRLIASAARTHEALRLSANRVSRFD